MKKLLLVAAAIGAFVAVRKKAAASQEADLWHEATATGGTRPTGGDARTDL
ncbi:MAG: DLW-39 family protein [Actinomycetota bacterium]|nr:DLW-39 family protein [Actinomycetota bacterium]